MAFPPNMPALDDRDPRCNYLSISCPETIQLTELSRMLAEIDQTRSESACSSTCCTDRRHFTAVNFVKLTLRSTNDRYVVYTAQKILVALVKQTCCQEALQLIDEMLNSGKHWEKMHMGLQICQQLFSKLCCHSYSVFCRLNSSICTVTNLMMSNTDCVYPDQCLYDFCSVCIKVVKIHSSQPEDGEFEIFLKQMLSTGFFCDILFHESVKHYVKSKLMQFLCSVLELSKKQQKVFTQEKVFVSSTVFKNLCSRDLRSTYVAIGNQTFVGIQCGDGSDKSSEAVCNNVNIAHIREWTYLLFTVSSCLIQQQEYVARVTEYLSDVDTFLQCLLNVSSSLPFPWFPHVYRDQDDVWIDILLLVLDIYPIDNDKQSSENSANRCQHHMHFLHFIRTLGYDHLVLIDLLTSPETKCLSYITKYLKLLHISWSEFIHVTELLVSAEDKEDTSAESSLDEDQTSVSESMCKMVIESSDSNFAPTPSGMIESSDSNFAPTPSGLLAKLSDQDSVDNNNEERTGTASKGGGLALIIGAYDDESDNDSDDNLGDNDSTNVDANSDTGNCKVQTTNSCCSEENLTFECKDSDSSEHYDTCTSFKDESTVNRVCVDSDDYVEDAACDEIEVESEDDDIDNYDATKYKNVLRDLNADTSDCVGEENELLAKSMSMLIRTRLKLEKLRDSGLIGYNPKVLIHLISSVEEFYEGND